MKATTTATTTTSANSNPSGNPKGNQGVEMVGLYVRDQEEARAFYVDKLGFKVHTDVKNGDYRWLTVQHPDQPTF